MLRSIGIVLLLTCLLLQWVPDALHLLVHHDEEHTEHALPTKGDISFDIAHKHCKSPEKALNAGYFPAKIADAIIRISYNAHITFYAGWSPIRRCNLKSGRAPPMLLFSA